MIHFKDVEEAYQRISNFIVETPCMFSHALSEALNAKVFLKLEHMQRTGSFKERGALNCLLLLNEKEKAKGVVTASAGNHAQAVAYHAARLNMSATIFMPLNTPSVKILKTEGFGATVKLCGENYDDSHQAALEFSNREGAFYVHAYDSKPVIAGQGTVAIELNRQLPQIDKIIVPVGGGGLIAGIASAFSFLSPKTEIIGVEPFLLPSMAEAILHNGPVKLKAANTIADGIRVRRVGNITYEICSQLVFNWVLVDDDQISKAILFLMENQKIVAEGAGAAGVAAVLEKKVDDLKDKVICIVVGGGNIDAHVLMRVIEKGMVETGRLMRLKVKIQDQPGKLSELLQVISSTLANVIEVRHERAFISSMWSEVQVDLVLQTRHKKHMNEIISLLKAKGYAVI